MYCQMAASSVAVMETERSVVLLAVGTRSRVADSTNYTVDFHDFVGGTMKRSKYDGIVIAAGRHLSKRNCTVFDFILFSTLLCLVG